MKKLLLLLLSAALLLSLCACDKQKDESDQSDQSSEAVVTDAETAKSLLAEGKIQEAHKLLFFSSEKEAKELLKKFTVVYTQELVYYSDNYPESVLNSITRTYDDRGNLLVEENGDTKTTYTYDEKGNVLSKQTESGETVFTSSFTYDSEGRKTSHTEEQKRDGRIISKTTQTMEYDKYGNITKRVTEDSFGFSNTYLVEYTYDSEGRILTSKNNTGFDEEKTYTYDDRGNLIEICVDGEDKFIYTYDENNNLLSEEYKGAYRDAWDYIYKYTYDSMGNKTSEYLKEIGNQSEETYERTFDDKGNLLKQVHSYRSGRIEKDTTDEYTYNEKGLQITRKQTSRDGDVNSCFTEELTYDDNGNIIKRAVCYNGEDKQTVHEYLDYKYFYNAEK